MTFQLLYISHPIELRGDISDLDILRTAQQYNASVNITGFLVRTRTHFAQILEGDEDVVAPLFEKIARDPRHSDVKLLMSTEMPFRQFSDWSMGYSRLHAPRAVGTDHSDWLGLLTCEADRQRQMPEHGPLA